MTDEEFMRGVITAHAEKNDDNLVKLYAERVQYYVDKMQITEFTDLDIPCIIAAAMITEKAYCKSFPDGVDLARDIVKMFGVTSVKYDRGEIKNGGI